MTARFSYSPLRRPPIPAVVATLLSPDGTRKLPGVSVHLDTAADRTLVPLHLLQQLGLQSTRQVTVHGLGTVPQVLDLYAIDIDIPGVGVISTQAVAHVNEPFVLLGRETLNLFRITLDGPNQVVEFH